MEQLPGKRQLFFLHSDTRNPPTRRQTRTKLLDSEVRRHLMVGIGRSRRKPPKDPQFETFIWSLAKTSEATSSASQGEHSTTRDVSHLQLPAKDLGAPETAERYNAQHAATTPTLHALSVFEKEWGEDRFSAYGFTLIVVAGRNAMSSTYSTNTFYFPFAFRQSAFLHHYQEMFTSPKVLIPLYRRSAGELKSLALERSLETIQCLESRLSSSDANSATSDSVLHAVLALICYNFSNADFDQAMIHVKGLWMVVAARGGISTLEANYELMLMISWVDIIAALLHDTKPLFPLSAPVPSASIFHYSGLETLPAPLLSVLNDENTQDTRLMNSMSCIGDLSSLASLVRFELATKGDAIWDDGEHMGVLMNPVTHKLLDRLSRSEPGTRWAVLSEALRLGAMIWIIRVKQRCRSYPGTAQARISALLDILSKTCTAKHVWNTPDLRIVRLWLLIICSISDPSEKDLTTSMRMIASEMNEQKSVSWFEIMVDIRQMPWIDIFEPPCAKLGQQLMDDHLDYQDYH